MLYRLLREGPEDVPGNPVSKSPETLSNWSWSTINLLDDLSFVYIVCDSVNRNFESQTDTHYKSVRVPSPDVSESLFTP